jgi:hypothetical protein
MTLGDILPELIAGIPTITLLALLVYFLKNPDKVEKWAAIIARWFSGASQASERRSVSGDIQADINSFAKNVTSQVDSTILPYTIKINWEKPEEVSYDSFIKDGQVVVRMRHHSNQARNFALATLAYVETGFLPDVRPHLDAEVSDSMNHTMVRRILLDRKRTDALSLFEKEYAVGNNPNVQRMSKILQDLDAAGFFDQMLLRELADVGKRLTGITPTANTRHEITEFVFFCEKLTEKERGKDVSPTYNGVLLRVSIVMVAKSKTYLELGVEPHLNWVDRCVENQVDSIYVCARGPNIRVARELDVLLQTNKSLRRISEHTGKVVAQKGEVMDGICIVYRRLA